MHITTDFPGGNGRIVKTERNVDGEKVWFLAEHKQGEPQALWFHFRIERPAGPKIQCVLVNAHQCLGSMEGWGGNAPVYRVGNRGWQRVSTGQVKWDEHGVPCYEFALNLSSNDRSVEVAFCYPYQQADLQRILDETQVWKTATIGYSAKSRPIFRIYNQLRDDKPKRGVYVIARQHSGETTGSWVMDGMLRYLASAQGKGTFSDLCWWMVPFTDIDGVEEGYYGKDQYPVDVNRAWTDIPGRPENHVVQQDIKRWEKVCQPLIALDLHAPAHDEKGFYFKIPKFPNATSRMAQHMAEHFYHRVPKELRGSFSFNYSGTMKTSTQEGVNAQGYIVNTLGHPGVTVEISYQGPDRPYHDQYYAIADYQKLGECLVQTIDTLAKSVNENWNEMTASDL